MVNMTEKGLGALAHALRHITHKATEDHAANPRSNLHLPARHESARAWLAKFIPESDLHDLEVRHHMGNYVIDRETGEKTFEEMSIYVRLGMHLLYYGSTQEKVLHWKETLDIVERESRKLGEEYDSPQSRAHIEPFIDSFHLRSSLSELKEPDPSKYPCFNAFFAREIRDDARPIAEPDNDLVTSSPADCRLTAYPTIDLATRYWIKGYGFTVAKMLGVDEDDALARQFDGGSIVIARLAPQDYHRWHAPVSGTVESIKEIPGAYYTVNPQAINEPGIMNVFCENRRSVMILRRSTTGAAIAVIAVGAMLVGSIKYNPGVGPGVEVRRGQCLGAFYYGGSTVIVLYPKGEVTLDEDLVRNSTEQACETRMKVGWRVGVKM
ncbi:hypothetical protein VTN77DRAFT_7520 [Rasamsonia byssochlamydoides]|uniref:uncharacterized protein n=1 Tax=Rasamsonia byssochlamydoides TaxID=89139 RepID=UPI003743ECE3